MEPDDEGPAPDWTNEYALWAALNEDEEVNRLFDEASNDD